MAQMPNPQRVPLVEPSTGLMAREWVRYFSEIEAAIAAASGAGGDTIVNNETTNVYQLEEEVTLGASAPSLAAARKAITEMAQAPAQPLARFALLERRIASIEEGTTP